MITTPARALVYSLDFLEPGNPGGWISSLKTFDEDWHIGPGYEIEADIWLRNCPEGMVSGAFYITYDTSKLTLLSVKAYDNNDLPGPWISANKFPNVGGPGTYWVTLLNMGCANPDGSGNLLLGKARFRSDVPGDAAISIQIDTDPVFLSFAGCSSTPYDSQIIPETVSMHIGPPALRFDIDGDGTPEENNAANLLLCEETAAIDIWLTGLGLINTTGVQFSFTWNTDKLNLQGSACNSEQWTTCPTPIEQGPGQYLFEVQKPDPGVAGPKVKLYTVYVNYQQFPTTGNIGTGNGVVDFVGGGSTSDVDDAYGSISAACVDLPLDCVGGNCDVCDVICSDSSGVPEIDEYYWEPASLGTNVNGGTAISVFHRKEGHDIITGPVGSPSTICEADLFRLCLRDCQLFNNQPCHLKCTSDCGNDFCVNLSQKCNTYLTQVDCNNDCYTDCYSSFNEDECSFTRECGFDIGEYIYVYDGTLGTCAGSPLFIYELQGACTARKTLNLPLAGGSYDVCSGSGLIERFTVNGVSEACAISIPTNTFSLNSGVSENLPVTITNIDAGGTYQLMLRRYYDDAHTIEMDPPPFWTFPLLVLIWKQERAPSLTSTQPIPIRKGKKITGPMWW